MNVDLRGGDRRVSEQVSDHIDTGPGIGGIASTGVAELVRALDELAVTIERATRAGVMGYLLKPLRECELRPAIELAMARFQEFLTLQKENEDLKKTLGARKIIERAKSILMESRHLTEA